jgi:BirA family biotin operon repressor/biotin-[acetyl-CoA-carboxylase] ligase
VLADEQTAGRGRLNRAWIAPPGTSLLFSLILRPNLDPQRAQALTMLCGLAVRDAIHATSGLHAHLKWPNDILLGERKAGGILIEISTTGTRLGYAVAGIGLNVNLPPSTLPSSFHATSIQEELGCPVSRAALLQEILRRVEERYVQLEKGDWPLREWAASLVTLGKLVRIETISQTLVGTAEAVDENGALCLRLDDGRLLQVQAGDVTPAPEMHPDRGLDHHPEDCDLVP